MNLTYSLFLLAGLAAAAEDSIRGHDHRKLGKSSKDVVVVHHTKTVVHEAPIPVVVRTPTPVVVMNEYIPTDPIVRVVPDVRTIIDGGTCGGVSVVPENMGLPLSCADETKAAIENAFDVDVRIEDRCDDDHILCLGILDNGGDCQLVIHEALHRLDDLLPLGCEIDEVIRMESSYPLRWYNGDWFMRHGGHLGYGRRFGHGYGRRFYGRRRYGPW